MRRALLSLTLVPVAAVLVSCGGESPAEHAQAPARLEHRGASNVSTIVLSQVGMQRVGVQTARVSALPARGHRGPTATIPYSALVYESDGTAAAYTQASPGTFTRAALSVAYISGNTVFLNSGPPPGTRVVTVGAEELLGVENGVGVQS